MLVRGANFDGGSAPRVAFGALTPVPASHVGAGELRCLTPVGEAIMGTVEVRVSLDPNPNAHPGPNPNTPTPTRCV